jgi:CRISPR system Cascade subunit CasD
MRDYQTATGIVTASGDVKRDRTVVSPRYYLSDAAFLVGLEGADQRLLLRIHQAVRSPVWPLSLGRKSFVPGSPPYLPDALREQGLLDALESYPRLASPQRSQQEGRLRVLLEDLSEGSIRLDQPLAPFAERRFGPRFVKSGVINVPDQINA